MTQNETSSVEALLREDRNFCKSFPQKSELDISSWMAESKEFSAVKIRKEKNNTKKLPIIREEKTFKGKSSGQSGGLEDNRKPFAIQELFAKVSDRVINNLEINKKFEQLGFSELKPVFYPAKYESFIKGVKFRSCSLGYEDPEFSHFGFSIPDDKKNEDKDKFNLYNSSYYTKFFSEGNTRRTGQNDGKGPVKNFGYSKFSGKIGKNDFKLPELRSRSSVTTFAMTNHGALNSNRLMSISSSLK
jgi:hypothetical protein